MRYKWKALGPLCVFLKPFGQEALLYRQCGVPWCAPYGMLLAYCHALLNRREVRESDKRYFMGRRVMGGEVM